MTADEVLKQMQIVAALRSENPVCVIDAQSRTITVPEQYKLFGVENDKRVERVYFQCPKIVGDNQDLSQGYQLFINYQNANGDPDAYHIDDMSVEGENITFSWLLEENVTKYKGNIKFAFGAIKPGDELLDPDKNRWNTTINTDCTCLIGLKCTQQVAESNPDALAQIWAAIDELKAGGGGSGTPGKDGREIEIQNNGTAIQWRYVGEEDWIDLVQLSEITGKTPNIKIGKVATLEPGTPATATMTGTPENPLLNLGIPKGKPGGGEGGGGITKKQITALDELFKIVAYTTNPESQYKSFCEAFGIEPVIPPEGKYTVTNNLTNVSNNNPALSIDNGEAYNAVLIPDVGYEIESVIIEMGLIDVTNEVYSDGSININSVTGNIVITAIAVQSSASGQLPQDGLVDYFDFRNKSYTAGSGGLYYINSDYGSGMLYSWSNQANKQGDGIGLKGVTGSYTSERATGYPVTDNFPSTRTVCLFGKGGPSVPSGIGADSTLPNSFLYTINYKATDKTTKRLPNESIQYPEGFSKEGYNASFVIVNQNILKIYFDDTLHKTVDGSEIEDFESWDLTPLLLTSFANYGTAYVIYSKELSEVEIVEALEFFKTLEVSE